MGQHPWNVTRGRGEGGGREGCRISRRAQALIVEPTRKKKLGNPKANPLELIVSSLINNISLKFPLLVISNRV